MSTFLFSAFPPNFKTFFVENRKCKKLIVYLRNKLVGKLIESSNHGVNKTNRQNGRTSLVTRYST